jgi:hypothetical protein
MDTLIQKCLLIMATCLAFQIHAVAAHAGEAEAGIQTKETNQTAHRNVEEDAWFQQFQEGTMLIDGWMDITRELLGKVGPAERAVIENALARLGEKIGREWARDNDVRKIDNMMLRVWGNRLKSAARKQSDLLALEIAKIDQEASRLLD